FVGVDIDVGPFAPTVGLDQLDLDIGNLHETRVSLLICVGLAWNLLGIRLGRIFRDATPISRADGHRATFHLASRWASSNIPSREQMGIEQHAILRADGHEASSAPEG